MKIIPNIHSPLDLKKLSLSELSLLASEIRQFIIEVMESNGGHLASSLGSVELILALHYVFDSPFDKLIFDTSHQTYAHKIVTGRKDLFPTIRKFGGLSGFLSPKESPHDLFYAGHAGTGLSLALGVAKSRDLRGGNEHVIPVISDAPFACGLTLEALNHIPKNLKNFILLLNDNAMAISHGVGTIHNEILRNKGRSFFEPFHFHYTDPIDGHDLPTVIRALEKAKNSPVPIVIHAITVKGYGMQEAVKDQVGYHGVKPINSPPSTKPTFPKIFGKHLLKMSDRDPSIVTVTPAMSNGSCLDALMEKYPERCIDVGIAEGHAVTFAGGLAYGGHLKVVCSIYATFFQRALDNLFQDVVLQNLPVLFALDRGGLSPSDGTTHHGVFDIAFLYAMPNMVIAQPRDGNMLKDLMESAFAWNRPTAIRYPNMSTEETGRATIQRPLGKGEILAYGKGVALIALGHMCKIAMAVREILKEEGITATVVDPIFVKPIDKELFFQLILDHDTFVTIEEHSVTTGLGMAINSFCSDVQVLNFGLPDQFIEHGSHEELMNEAGLTPQKIAIELLERGICEKYRHMPERV